MFERCPHSPESGHPGHVTALSRSQACEGPFPLSGRLCHARILIFDEATSALDYESERIIQHNMREIAKRRTVLIIAHRLSTVRATDRIVTPERGRLVEDGTHEMLVRTGGRYASLHRLQAGIHEVR